MVLKQRGEQEGLPLTLLERTAGRKEVGWVGGLRDPQEQTLVWRRKPDEGICAESSFLCCDPNGGHMRAPGITAASGPSLP